MKKRPEYKEKTKDSWGKCELSDQCPDFPKKNSRSIMIRMVQVLSTHRRKNHQIPTTKEFKQCAYNDANLRWNSHSHSSNRHWNKIPFLCELDNHPSMQYIQTTLPSTKLCSAWMPSKISKNHYPAQKQTHLVTTPTINGRNKQPKANMYIV